MVLADVPRRLFAAVIDLIPPGLLVLMIWYGDIVACWRDGWAALSAGLQPVFPMRVVIAWVAFRGILFAYCVICELASCTTPGKRLMGFSVLSESGTRPGRGQVVIRNLVRLVELEPALMIWPFVMVILFTRNRQRLGDLLARTVVVGRYDLPPEEDSDTVPPEEER
jgi:uncharacterized RDD family membrane protein YckC